GQDVLLAAPAVNRPAVHRAPAAASQRAARAHRVWALARAWVAPLSAPAERADAFVHCLCGKGACRLGPRQLLPCLLACLIGPVPMVREARLSDAKDVPYAAWPSMGPLLHDAQGPLARLAFARGATAGPAVRCAGAHLLTVLCAGAHLAVRAMV